jgi:hypothetical protein
MVPCAGTLNGCGISRIMSGFPMFQPSRKASGAGAFAGSPSRAPASAQRAMMSISASVRRRSFPKWPTDGSACQGGMVRLTTARFIADAQGRASL